MSRPQIQALTALRGAAAWWVVLYHCRDLFPAGTPGFIDGFAAKGNLAVDLFFILSGFVIALNYEGRLRSWNARGALQFLGSRLARIYPLHLVMMIAYLATPLAIHLFASQPPPPGSFDPGYYVMSLLLIQNWGFVTALDWNQPAWSISTEWFAYLVFPFICAGILRHVRGVGVPLVLMAALMIILGVMMVRGLGGYMETLGLWRCLVEFQLGVLLCRLRGARPAGPGDGSDAAALGALLLIGVFVAFAVPDQWIIPAALALLIWSLTNPASILSRLLDRPWLVRIGEISYSTYLSHFFIKDWVKFLVIGPGTSPWISLLVYLFAVLLASFILFRWVEQPGQRLVRGWLERPRMAKLAEATR